MFAHFKWTGLSHELHLMELKAVKFFGNNFKHKIQKSAFSSSSSTDRGEILVFKRLLGCGAFFGVFLFVALLFFYS